MNERTSFEVVRDPAIPVVKAHPTEFATDKDAKAYITEELKRLDALAGKHNLIFRAMVG